MITCLLAIGSSALGLSGGSGDSVLSKYHAASHPLSAPPLKSTKGSSHKPSKPPTNPDTVPSLSESDVIGILKKAHLSTKIVQHQWFGNDSSGGRKLKTGGSLVVSGFFGTTDPGPTFGPVWALSGYPQSEASGGDPYPQYFALHFDPNQSTFDRIKLTVKHPKFLIIYNLKGSSDLQKGKAEVDGGETDQSQKNGPATGIWIEPNGISYLALAFDTSKYYYSMIRFWSNRGAVYLPRIDLYELG